MKQLFSVLLVLGLVSACQNLKTADRSEWELKKTQGPSSPSVQSTANGSQVLKPLSQYKVAVIFGPGGVNSLAASGVVKFLEEKSVNIDYVVGLGFGAVFGAFYAHHQKVHEVDWQVFKMKDMSLQKKSFFGSSKKGWDFSLLESSLQDSFGDKKIENFKGAFACTDPQISQGVFRLQMNGLASQALRSCLPVSSSSVPARQSLQSFAQLMDFLEEKGLDFIVFVDSLSGFSPAESKELSSEQKTAWWKRVELSSGYAKMADFSFDVSASELDIYHFSQAKLHLRRGYRRAQQQWEPFLNALKRHKIGAEKAINR